LQGRQVHDEGTVVLAFGNGDELGISPFANTHLDAAHRLALRINHAASQGWGAGCVC